ncbi:MAG: PIN domain-containing protein [Chitinophagales bacterium]|nr:PIN domain-containing protein [Chitinophagales bacterium]
MEFFNGNTELLIYINKNISFENIVTTVITEAELIKSAVNKESQQKIEKFLTDVENLPITINASNTFSELIKKYHLSHSAKLPDCLIVSICISRNFAIVYF